MKCSADLCGIRYTADRREFLRISQAVGMGFLIMGVIGYVVKLSKFTPPCTPGEEESADGGVKGREKEGEEKALRERRSQELILGLQFISR